MLYPPRNAKESLSSADSRAAERQSENDARFSFAKFASHQFFKEVNTWLVAHAGILSDSQVVDLGCGPGLVSELVLERMGPGATGIVYAVDPSPAALDLARTRIRSKIVQFVQGAAEQIATLIPSADVVLFCNAIHLIADKAQALSSIARALKPNGILAFNTTFFHGAYPGNTPRFYKLWILRATRWLQERDYQVARGVKATAMQWLHVDEYRDLLRSAGFEEVTMELQEKPLSRQSLEDISEFSLFIEGALPGVSLEVGSEALKAGVRRAFEELQLEMVPRNWLQAVARLTRAPTTSLMASP